MKRSTFVRCSVLLALVASGCTCKRGGGSDQASKESPAALKIDPPDDLDLPHSRTNEALPTEAIPIYVSRSHIAVGFQRRDVAVLGDRQKLAIGGVDPKYKGTDPTTIQALSDAVDAVRKEKKLGDFIPAVVVVDASIPFRVVAEVVLTVQKLRFDRYSLVVKRQDGSLGGIGFGKGHQPTDQPPPPPAGADAAVPHDASIYLGVRIVDDGFMVRAFNRELGPDCTSATAGTTLPKKDGAYDVAGLTACARQVRARAPDSHDHFVTFSVAPAVAFSDVVRAIDALQSPPDGKTLFADVGLTLVH